MQTSVVRYDGDRALEKGLALMTGVGSQVQSISTRRALLSLVAGPFTSMNIHSVVYVGV